MRKNYYRNESNSTTVKNTKNSMNEYRYHYTFILARGQYAAVGKVAQDPFPQQPVNAFQPTNQQQQYPQPAFLQPQPQQAFQQPQPGFPQTAVPPPQQPFSVVPVAAAPLPPSRYGSLRTGYNSIKGLGSSIISFAGFAFAGALAVALCGPWNTMAGAGFWCGIVVGIYCQFNSLRNCIIRKDYRIKCYCFNELVQYSRKIVFYTDIYLILILFYLLIL